MKLHALKWTLLLVCAGSALAFAGEGGGEVVRQPPPPKEPEKKPEPPKNENAGGNAAQPEKAGARRARLITIPTRDAGYGKFGNQILPTREAFNKFMAEVNKMKADHWTDRAAFIKALTDAKIDFSKETLILERHNESSGSVKVTVKPPTTTGDGTKVTLDVVSDVPQAGTADMAYYVFAFAVQKGVGAYGVRKTRNGPGNVSSVAEEVTALPNP